MSPREFSSPVPFILIDDTEISGSWYCGIPDWAEQVVLGKSSLIQDDTDLINDPKIDMHSLLTKLQHEFLHNQINEIPNVMYVENIESLYSRIIADAAIQSGILYTRANWEKAVAQIFSITQEKPSFLGITLDAKLAIDISPLVMLWLTVLLWHSVRRIEFSKKPFEEPWILTDVRGPIEGILAAFWVTLMLASVVAVIWAVLVYNDARLPRLGDLQFFWNFSLENPYIMDKQLRRISWMALIGGLLVIAGFLPLIGVIHLIFKAECNLYNNLVSRMRFRRKRSSA